MERIRLFQHNIPSDSNIPIKVLFIKVNYDKSFKNGEMSTINKAMDRQLNQPGYYKDFFNFFYLTH